MASFIRTDPLTILIHILALIWDDDMSHCNILKRINTKYPKCSILYKMHHELSSFTYWQSYVKDQMSMDALYWINYIIIFLTELTKTILNGQL